MACQFCGVEGPTQAVCFEQNIGMLYARRGTKVEAELCRPCIGMYFRSFTLTTLFIGWWGIISLFMTPVILFSNVSQFLRARHLPAPGLSVSNLPLGHQPRLVSQSTFMFKLVYGVAVWAIVLGLIASHQVDLLERHAPALNAKLHNGEITDESDGEYAGLQVGKDIAAIEADIKSTEWGGMRTEMLARENSVLDLDTQNERFQRRMAIERSQNLGKDDPCEQFALDSMGPALNDYSKSLDQLYAFVKGTPTLTKDNSESLQNLSKGEDDALKRLQQVFASDSSKGCDKK